jgi:RimJ/RimL family protein N-acetyltransferase
MQVIETARLRMRHMTNDDAPFVLALLNDPSFIRHIGDKGVRTMADACTYIARGPVASYDTFGFGLYLVELKDACTPIGICGLVKREQLPEVDIGFAFLPAFWSHGYAIESASAVKTYARDTVGLRRLVAITDPDNQSSIRLLEKIGFTFERTVRMSRTEPELNLFVVDV